MSDNKGRRLKLSCGQWGFTLLEVLVSIVVLSVGLLGLAALQLSAQQSAHYSYQVTIANLAAKDANERLWKALIENDACPANNELNSSDWGGWLDPEKLPGMEITVNAGVLDCEYEITIIWKNDRLGVELFSENDDAAGRFTSLNYYVRLPGLPVASP